MTQPTTEGGPECRVSGQGIIHRGFLTYQCGVDFMVQVVWGQRGIGPSCHVAEIVVGT